MCLRSWTRQEGTPIASARITPGLVKKHGFPEYTLTAFAAYGRNKREALERAAHTKASMPQIYDLDESQISLTKLAQTHSDDSPRHVIQSCLLRLTEAGEIRTLKN